ncbi:MAG: 1,4-dihydroxy-2-naphthoate octaprenyltransferase [Verrucomicrobiota bacterium]|nr:1,4-dihydroxy-2-naphthoate octaprenyltransferase [Verrucomicrobiota bacterium]
MILHWIRASRPKTLLASLVPVYIGSVLAYSKYGIIEFQIPMLCFLFSLLVQIGTNFANDYFDYVKGGDTRSRIGPERMVQSGVIQPRKMLMASILISILALFVGLILFGSSEVHPSVLPLGIVCILCAFFYTGGPFPIAYNALGDVFVILFFGFVAVVITEYFISSSLGFYFAPTYHIGFCVGLIINNLLIVNNYRDFEEDSKSGKRTTIVLLGRKFGMLFFFVGSIVACILPALFDPNCWLCLLNIPFVIMIARKLSSSSTKSDFDQVLTLSALLMVSYSISISLGILS